MEDQTNNTLLPITALSDLATILKDKGLSDSEVAETLLKVITEVHMEVVEELMEKLPEEKKALLDTLVSQNASGEEIAEKLELDKEDLSEIEMRKFAQIVQKMVPSLNYE